MTTGAAGPQSPPFEYRRDDARRRITVIAHRALNVEDFAGVIDRQAADGTWSYGILWDLRESRTPLPVPDADLVAAHVYRNLIRYGSRGPVAVVTGSPTIVSATAAYGSKTRPAGVQIRAFAGIAEAEEWLGQSELPWASRR
jgi:hypothetical protein